MATITRGQQRYVIEADLRRPQVATNGLPLLQGHLIVERCERFCWYCFEKKGKTKVWKHPWYVLCLSSSLGKSLTDQGTCDVTFWTFTPVVLTRS